MKTVRLMLGRLLSTRASSRVHPPLECDRQHMPIDMILMMPWDSDTKEIRV